VIRIKPNTNYVLSFNVTSLSGTNSTAKLAFGAFINCSRVGEDITQDYTTKCNWARYTILLNSGSLSSFTLSIANISALTNGFNDIAIDDITLFECTQPVARPFPSITKFQWRGYSTDWFKRDNWGQCGAPSCGENITLPSA
jgi:predicted Rdx family selenoprotein